MQFESFEAFLHMGGYAFYVWLSFGVTALVMVLIAVISHKNHKHLLRRVVEESARQARIKKARQRTGDNVAKTTDQNELV